MTRKTQKDRWVSTVAQMRALGSPVRHQVHLAMEMLGPCSVRELAARMNREPATLYYHLRIMERGGLFKKPRVRGRGPSAETIFELRHDRVRVDMEQRAPRFVAALTNGSRALLRYAERTFVAALRRDETIKSGKASELRVNQVTVRLTRKSLTELNTRLDELFDAAERADSPATGTAYAVTVCVAPVNANDQ